MTIQTAIEHLKAYPLETPCAMAVWLPVDVKEAYRQNFDEDESESNRYGLSDKEIATVLEYVEDTQDAELGITWETIRCAIDRILEDRDKAEVTL